MKKTLERILMVLMTAMFFCLGGGMGSQYSNYELYDVVLNRIVLVIVGIVIGYYLKE